jgi:hypothetical protein
MAKARAQTAATAVATRVANLPEDISLSPFFELGGDFALKN